MMAGLRLFFEASSSFFEVARYAHCLIFLFFLSFLIVSPLQSQASQSPSLSEKTRNKGTIPAIKKSNPIQKDLDSYSTKKASPMEQTMEQTMEQENTSNAIPVQTGKKTEKGKATNASKRSNSSGKSNQQSRSVNSPRTTSKANGPSSQKRDEEVSPRKKSMSFTSSRVSKKKPFVQRRKWNFSSSSSSLNGLMEYIPNFSRELLPGYEGFMHSQGTDFPHENSENSENRNGEDDGVFSQSDSKSDYQQSQGKEKSKKEEFSFSSWQKNLPKGKTLMNVGILVVVGALFLFYRLRGGLLTKR